MKILTRVFAACLIAAAFSSARAADDQKSEKPFNDADFIKQAGSCTMHEVELGKIAQTKATNAGVKSFAEMMVTEHTKCLDEMKQLAREIGVEFPTKMEAEHQKHVDKFRDYKGENFDRDYITHMVDDHQKAVEWTTRATKEAKNEKLKEAAIKGLPKLKEHLEAAKKLKAELK